MKSLFSSGWKYFGHVLIRRNVSSIGSDSTIYAVASGGVKSAIAVIRVSGKLTSEVVRRIVKSSELPKPRRAVYKKFYDASSTNTVIDHGILLWFPAPRSYTGEDSCEFQVHGGRAVISGMLHSIGSISGCRMSDPGEFTKRAFLNGKMDLTEVEGLSDLISAETEMQRIQAINQLDGSLGKLYESWRDRIARCLANAEAYIDFGEDENIESDILCKTEAQVRAIVSDIESHLNDNRKGEMLRNGVRVAILGKPNVGKSSLLNILCEREAAIVSHIPGTTRDVIETTVNFGGYPILFADTAGIRQKPGDIIEQEGIRRSVKEGIKADLVILLIDPTTARNYKSLDDLVTLELSGILADSNNIEDQWSILFNKVRKKLFVVMNKIDLIGCKGTMNEEIEWNLIFSETIPISCTMNLGMEKFFEELNHRISSLCADPKCGSVYLTRERYRLHLGKCIEHLNSYINSTTTDLALKTEHLKNGMNSIGFITGHFDIEALLDIIFKEFCIGK